MTGRQRRFIAGAFIANNGGRFHLLTVSEMLGWTEAEAEDVYATVAHTGLFLPVFGAEQEFTPQGRELARELIENGDGEGL